MIIGEIRAERRAMRTRKQECESMFLLLLTKAIISNKIKDHPLVEVGDSLMSRDFFANGKSPARNINPYYALTYAEEARYFLVRLGWHLEKRRFWFFQHPEPIGNIIAYALEKWHCGTHADRIDLAEAKRSAYRCGTSGFRKAAEETLMLLWALRITFVQKSAEGVDCR